MESSKAQQIALLPLREALSELTCGDERLPKSPDVKPVEVLPAAPEERAPLDIATDLISQLKAAVDAIGDVDVALLRDAFDQAFPGPPIVIDAKPANDDGSFAARVRAVREERGWSTRRLAKEAGVSQATVNHIEVSYVKGGGKAAQKLASFLGISVDNTAGP